MTWLNGRKPPYMDGAERVALTKEQVAHAACCLSYEGARLAAAAFIMLANRQGLSPKDITNVIETGSDFQPVQIKQDAAM